jgi:hypothetical protein
MPRVIRTKDLPEHRARTRSANSTNKMWGELTDNEKEDIMKTMAIQLGLVRPDA